MDVKRTILIESDEEEQELMNLFLSKIEELSQTEQFSDLSLNFFKEDYEV